MVPIAATYDPEANSVRVILVPEAHAKFQVAAWPGSPPCDMFLGVTDRGFFTSLLVWNAKERFRDRQDEIQPQMRYDANANVAYLEFFPGEPSREVPFDWPEDQPKWRAAGLLDGNGVLLRVRFGSASEHLQAPLIGSGRGDETPGPDT
jgi:hypothetical protein